MTNLDAPALRSARRGPPAWFWFLILVAANFTVAWFQISSVNEEELPGDLQGIFSPSDAGLISAIMLAGVYMIIEMAAMVIAWTSLIGGVWMGGKCGWRGSKRAMSWLLAPLE
jgi:hypothetical protein